jgi:hypothetical protein
MRGATRRLLFCSMVDFGIWDGETERRSPFFIFGAPAKRLPLTRRSDRFCRGGACSARRRHEHSRMGAARPRSAKSANIHDHCRLAFLRALRLTLPQAPPPGVSIVRTEPALACSEVLPGSALDFPAGSTIVFLPGPPSAPPAKP